MHFRFRLQGNEGVEVINPEGGKEDAEEEAQKGRWKDEVTNQSPMVSLILLLKFLYVSFLTRKKLCFVLYRNEIVTGR